MSSELFGKRLRQARKARGYATQDDFAQTLSKRYGVDVQHSMISLMENGKRQPSLAILEAIATDLDVSIDWLRGRYPDMQLPVHGAHARKAATLVDELPAHIQPEAVEILQSLCDKLIKTHDSASDIYEKILSSIEEYAGTDIRNEIERSLSLSQFSNGTQYAKQVA